MELKEAIAHAREVAENCGVDGRDCAYQHDKLADWLEELQAYRETGLAPEGIIALQKVVALRAKFEGVAKEARPLLTAKLEERLIVLPCRITDTVYLVEDVFKKKKKIGERIVSALIDHATIGGENGHLTFELCSETGGWYCSMEPDDFYLTREEAERAVGWKEATP